MGGCLRLCGTRFAVATRVSQRSSAPTLYSKSTTPALDGRPGALVIDAQTGRTLEARELAAAVLVSIDGSYVPSDPRGEVSSTVVPWGAPKNEGVFSNTSLAADGFSVQNRSVDKRSRLSLAVVLQLALVAAAGSCGSDDSPRSSASTKAPAAAAAGGSSEADRDSGTDRPTVTIEHLSETVGDVALELDVPVLSGLGSDEGELNAQIREQIVGPAREVAEQADESTNAMSFEVEANTWFENDALIVVELNEYSYLGGAHPNSRFGSLLIDVERAALVAPSDLVRDRQAQGRFDALIEASLEQRSDDLFPEWREYVDPATFDSAAWLPNDDGLTLRYSPYELAPYAAGPVELTLDWAGVAATDAFVDASLLATWLDQQASASSG